MQATQFIFMLGPLQLRLSKFVVVWLLFTLLLLLVVVVFHYKLIYCESFCWAAKPHDL